MPKESKFLTIVIKALPTLYSITRKLNAFKYLLNMVLNIIFDYINFNYVFPKAIILYICYLSIFITLLSEII